MSKSSRRRARVRSRKQGAGTQTRPTATPAAPIVEKPARARPVTAQPRAAKAATRTVIASRPLIGSRVAATQGRGDAAHAIAWRSGALVVAAIARRELTALFVSPVGWVVAAIFTFIVSGFGFISPVLAGQQGTMDGVFGVVTGFLMLILIPLITMRVFAEERSQGTLELLMTAPIRDWELTAGKWLGAFAFYALLIATTLVYVGVLAVYVPGHLATLDVGLIGATYVGLLLVGAAATAIGVLASSLTRSQIVAFFLSLGGILLVWYAGALLGLVTHPPANQWFEYVGGYNRYQSFSLGNLTLRDTLYFVSLAAGALFLTTRLLDSRRWR
jgi:gliding motility-associated transport system permease protein